ncbi:MAG TPA: MarC family protein [Thermoanaerobaculia bacterium]|nr:MarC family protein [Thermoanaerobaculia bacterium]
MFTHAEAEFALLAFSSLFSVINPISAAPIFVLLTEGAPEGRRQVALRASMAAAAILAVFAAAGGAIFTFFGITVPAFQIAGGIIFAAMSMRTLDTGREEIPEDDIENADPSVVPIGIPLIAGPGAISTVMILIGQAQDGMRRLALAAAIAVNILLTFVILLAAPSIVARIGPTGQRIVNKIMGLITAVIGVQFVINGVTTVVLSILRAPRG